jgi:hypothetical protein
VAGWSSSRIIELDYGGVHRDARDLHAASRRNRRRFPIKVARTLISVSMRDHETRRSPSSGLARCRFPCIDSFVRRGVQFVRHPRDPDRVYSMYIGVFVIYSPLASTFQSHGVPCPIALSNSRSLSGLSGKSFMKISPDRVTPDRKK